MMGKRILVILGHPSSNSFCAALAERYSQSAVRAGHEVRQLFLGTLAVSYTHLKLPTIYSV